MAAAALTAEEMADSYESAEGRGNTCAENPARLSVTRNPDHVTFDWPVAIEIFNGSFRRTVTYDLIEEQPEALVLRLEGETQVTESGREVIWLLWANADRQTFCWRRTDWPALRCDHVYRRCPDPAPTS